MRKTEKTRALSEMALVLSTGFEVILLEQNKTQHRSILGAKLSQKK
jgi:hypothetical protein